MEAAVARELDRLDKRLLAVEATPMKLAAVEAAHEVELSGLKADIARVEDSVEQLHERISTLRKDLTDREDRDAIRREDERAERKKDRQWLTGSLFAAAGLCITAFGLLADKL